MYVDTCIITVSLHRELPLFSLFKWTLHQRFLFSPIITYRYIVAFVHTSYSPQQQTCDSIDFSSAFSPFSCLSFTLQLLLHQERFWQHPRPQRSRQCQRQSWRPAAAKWSPGIITRLPRLHSQQLRSPTPQRPWQLTALMPLHLLPTPLPIPHLFYCNFSCKLTTIDNRLHLDFYGKIDRLTRRHFH